MAVGDLHIEIDHDKGTKTVGREIISGMSGVISFRGHEIECEDVTLIMPVDDPALPPEAKLAGVVTERWRVD